MADGNALKSAFALRKAGDYYAALEILKPLCDQESGTSPVDTCFEKWLIELHTSRENMRRFWDGMGEEPPPQAAETWNDPTLDTMLRTDLGHRAIDNWRRKGTIIRDWGFVQEPIPGTNSMYLDTEVMKKDRRFIYLFLNTGVDLGSLANINHDNPIRLPTILDEYLYYFYENKVYEIKNSKSHAGLIHEFGMMFEVMNFPGFTAAYWLYCRLRHHRSKLQSLSRWLSVLRPRQPRSQRDPDPGRGLRLLAPFLFLLSKLPLPVRPIADEQLVVMWPSASEKIQTSIEPREAAETPVHGLT